MHALAFALELAREARVDLVANLDFQLFRSALAQDPIVLGCPLSTAFLYGWDAERGVTLAVEEINAKAEADGLQRA